MTDTNKNTNKVEMNDEMMELVNGGGLWADFKSRARALFDTIEEAWDIINA